jgi:hypothetical protein
MDLNALKKEAKSPSPSPERLLELAKLDPSLSREIAKRYALPLDVARELTKSRDMPTRAALARNHRIPLEILEILARDSQWTVAKAVLGAKVNRKITLSRVIFETIARHKRHTVRQSAAEHFLCPADLLEELAADAAPEVRSSVAEHPKATPELLHRLASDAELRVVWNVATHINTSNKTLDLLAQHPNSRTREQSIYPYLGYSRTREIPVSRLEMLKNDPDPEVLRYVLWNKYTPTSLIEYIFTHHPVVFEVDNGYNTRQPMYASLDAEGLRHALSNHPDLDVKWLHRLAQIHNSMLIWALLNHPKISPEILDLMSKVYLGYLEQHPIADKALPQTELGLQEQLIKSAKFAIADFAAHPKTSQATLQDLIVGIKQTILIPHSIHSLCKSPHEMVQNALPDILEAIRVNHMAKSEDNPYVDYALAELCEFSALSIVSQKRILETISAEPRDTLSPNTIYRFKQSPHSLIQEYFAGMP